MIHMLFSQTPVFLFQKIYPSSVFYLNNSSQIALTFDDGPIPQVTEFVLDVLKYYNIKATFFCVGENIIKHPQVFEKILQNNHSVGNHTYAHENGWKTSNALYIESIQRFEKIFPTKLFRPPYGKMSYIQYKYLLQQKHKIVFWNIISYDYHHKMDKSRCFYLLKKYTVGGNIVLFHDSIKSFRLISEILPRYIEFCQKLNLTFVPLNP